MDAPFTQLKPCHLTPPHPVLWASSSPHWFPNRPCQCPPARPHAFVILLVLSHHSEPPCHMDAFLTLLRLHCLYWVKSLWGRDTLLTLLWLPTCHPPTWRHTLPCSVSTLHTRQPIYKNVLLTLLGQAALCEA